MPLPRKPSIRELHRARPGNVAILPTAPSRQVPNHQSREAREAGRALRAQHAGRFAFKTAGQRRAERQAEAMMAADAGAVLAVEVLAVLDLETRRRVIGRLEALAAKGPSFRQAADLAATTALNIGESMDLAHALKAMASRPDRS